MARSSLLGTIAGCCIIALSLAGLRGPTVEGERPPPVNDRTRLGDEISPENITGHITALSRQQSRQTATPGARQAVRYIGGYLRSIGWSVEEQPFEAPSGGTGINIVAGAPGHEDTDSLLLLCTHYDSRAEFPHGHAPGADDNASGAGVLLEVARILSLAFGDEHQIPVSILFFGGEEDSMLGSTHYAERLVAEQRAIAGTINIDMIGYDREGPKDFVIFTNSRSTDLARVIETCAVKLPRLRYETTLTDYANSDHGPFWSEGFRAISLWEGYDHNPYYHSSLDTADKLSPVFMALIARTVLCATLTLAPPMPGPGR